MVSLAGSGSVPVPCHKGFLCVPHGYQAQVSIMWPSELCGSPLLGWTFCKLSDGFMYALPLAIPPHCGHVSTLFPGLLFLKLWLLRGRSFSPRICLQHGRLEKVTVPQGLWDPQPVTVEGGRLLHRTVEARTSGAQLTPGALLKTPLKTTGIETSPPPPTLTHPNACHATWHSSGKIVLSGHCPSKPRLSPLPYSLGLPPPNTSPN